ncbi:7-deoxyloganetic acid glucosyltransferase-like protein [Tanacetum coccineum]
MSLSHLIYADDVVFLGVCVSDENISNMADILGCGVAALPLKYLGKFSSKLTLWNARLLSTGGRLSLIKSVLLGSLPTYYMSLYRVPVSVCNMLESMRNNFFIGGDLGEKKMTWSMLKQPSDLWAIVIKELHGHYGGIFDDPSFKSCYSPWCGILSSVKTLKQKGIDLLSLCIRKLGNGTSIRFWDDIWCGHHPLKVQSHRISMLDNDKSCCIANWSNVLRRQPSGGIESYQFSELQHLIGTVELSEHNDSWQWSLDVSRGFSVASVRSLIDSCTLDDGSSATRWNNMIPIKVNIFLWRLSLNELPSRMNLDRKGIEVDSLLCPICHEDVEMANHTFFNCDMAKDLRALLARWWELNIPFCENISEWFTWLDSSSLSTKARLILDGVGGTLLWPIWSFRNRLVFFNSSPKKMVLWDNIFVGGTEPINSIAFVFDGVNFGASDFAYSAYSMVADHRPVNCALKLAELLCLSGIHVTFLNTDHIHRPLIRHTDVLSRFSRYPNFQFETIPDGVEHEKPVSGDKFMEVMDAVDAVSKPVFREMMVSGRFSRSSERPVTVMIPDACFSFAVDIAKETSIPVVCFETLSPCCLWTSYLNLPTLLEAGDVKGDDLDQLITSVPGTEHIIRRRDLASFCRSDDLSNPVIDLVVKEARSIHQAQGLIINTFEELDGLILPHMRKLCPNIYTTGPLHSLHKARLLTADTTLMSQENTFTNSVWKEDRSCLIWLDKHPPKSVLYVSIGSLATMTIDQLLEIWHGVVNSEKPFLWVRRPGSITGGYDESIVPKELLERTKEIGFIVDWAPQEDVLGHQAVGGFLTHSGWNSTIESIVEGVPMICWPYFVDQQVNSRFVEEVWKVGVDMKDTCDRLIVENAVRDLMDKKQETFTQSANTWKMLAKEAIREIGSSSLHVGRLIDDIRAMTSTMK